MTHHPPGIAWARIEVLLAAALFSTGGAAIKLCGFTGWQVAGFRSGVAALALWILVPSARRGWSGRTWLVGCAYAACLVLFSLGNKLTTAAATIFLQSTAPLYVLVLGTWLLHEKPRRADVLMLAALGVGMGLCFVGVDPPQATAPRPFTGNLVAAASGVAWAFSVMGLRWLGRGKGPRDNPGASAATAGNLIAFIVCLPLALPLGPVTSTDWGVIVFLGVFQIATAYAFLTSGLKRVTALEASLLLLLEPVLNPVWAFFVHGETPGPWTVAGGVIILGATLTRSFQSVDFK